MWDGSSKENAMMKKAFWKGLIFVFVFLFSSCNDLFKPTMDEPVKDYLEYWSSTCQVGEVRYNTPHVEIDGVPNVAVIEVIENANEINLPIEIDLLCINPKQLKLLQRTQGGSPVKGFSLRYEGETDNIEGYEELAFDNDTSLVKIKAKLDDSHEGKTITLKGCLWPENRADYDEDSVRNLNPELFYETTFVQNTPPDNVSSVTTLKNGTFGDTNKHFLSFTIPNQDKKRNQGAKYEVKYWLRDGDDTSLTYQGSRILSLSDNKNPDPTSRTFQYFFDEQVPYLFYEYTVQVLGPRGLNSEVFATENGPGVHQLIEPTITIGKTPNGLFDEDNFECVEVAADSESVSYTATPANSDENISVTINSVPQEGANGTITGPGQYTIETTVTKDGNRPFTTSRKIRIVRTPSVANIAFGKQFNGKGQDTDDYWYIEVPNTSSTVSYTITNSEEGTTLSGTIDGTPFNSAGSSKTGSLDIKSHILTAVVHKQYCNDVTVTKKVKVVQELQEPTYSFKSNDQTNNPTGTKTGNFEWIEVPDGSTYVTYTITAASGCTMEVKKDYPNTSTTTVNSNTYMDNLVSLGGASYRDYTLTITVKKQYHKDQTFYKYIRLVQSLQEPTLKFYKDSSHSNLVSSHSSPENNSFLLFDTYDINLADDGTGYLYYTATSPDGASVKITDVQNSPGTEVNGKLAIGPHKLLIEVSKSGYQTKTFSDSVKKIYVQGVLTPIKVEYSAKKSGGSQVWTTITDTGSLQDLKFSYISYDKMPIRVSPGNTGNTIEVAVYLAGGSCVASGNTTGTYTCELEHSYPAYTITVNQSRIYCKKSTQESRKITAMIKPITLTSSNLFIEIDGFEADEFNAKGVISVRGPNQTTAIWDHENDQHKVTQNTWCTPEGSIKTWGDTFTDPTQKIDVCFYKFRRHRGSGLQKDKPVFVDGDYWFPAIKLSDIKYGKGDGETAGTNWTYICKQKSDGDQKARPKITFTVSD